MKYKFTGTIDGIFEGTIEEVLPITYPCTKCSEIFNTQEELDAHILSDHPVIPLSSMPVWLWDAVLNSKLKMNLMLILCRRIQYYRLSINARFADLNFRIKQNLISISQTLILLFRVILE